MLLYVADPHVDGQHKMSNSPKQNPVRSPPLSPRRPVTPRGSHRAPTVPSRLRESIAARTSPSGPDQVSNDNIPPISPILGSQRLSAEPESLVKSSSRDARGRIIEPSQREADARTRLLEDYHQGAICGSKHCSHGTFSPHLRAQDSISSAASSIHGFGGRHADDVNSEDGEARDPARGYVGEALANGLFGPFRKDTPMSTTKWLAKKHRVKGKRAMYV